jgi:putative acetyltransferase
MAVASEITIRRYRESDLDDVIAVFQAAIRETAARDYSPLQIAAWAQADRKAWARRRMDRPTWVARLGGAVVGFTDLETDGHLDMMFVHPARQGRGIASRLLATVEAAARADSLARIFTEASITARPFFERRGFRLIAAQTVAIRGQALTNFRMEKLLG